LKQDLSLRDVYENEDIETSCKELDDNQKPENKERASYCSG
jgi:hypothetical protein